MADYVYGCENKDHPRKPISHSMKVDPVILCEVCGKRMYRIPQPLGRFYMKPEEVLVAWMDDNYRRMRGKRKLRSPDLCIRPDKPIPQRDYAYRKRQKHVKQTNPA
jgi:hypothetical protein